MSQLIGMIEEKKKLTAAIKNRIPALLIGETGTGKTSLAIEAAEALSLNTVRVNLDGGVTPDEIIGRYQVKAENGASITYFQEGIVPRAMRAGSVLILDEINAALPDTLFCLHALLENNPRLMIPETGEEIIPSNGFSVIATMNPSHDYAGTKGLNAALYSRFGMVIRFKKLQGIDFLKALCSHIPDINAGVAERICSIIEEVEALRVAEKISTRLTLREAIAAGRFAMDGLTLKESIQAALIDKLEEYERAQVTNQYSAPAYSGVESVADIFERALHVAEAREEAAALREELESMKELKAALAVINKVNRKARVKPATEETSEKPATEETSEKPAWNPSAIQPWGKVTK